MNTNVDLRARVDEYLAERRRMGFGLVDTGYALHGFTNYVASECHQGPLTIELMAAWARNDKAQRLTPGTWARRLEILRPFMRWLRQFEPQTAVPDESIFGSVPGRVAPHIYHDAEIIELLAAARRINPNGSRLRPATFETLFGLIASAGLRVQRHLPCWIEMLI